MVAEIIITKDKITKPYYELDNNSPAYSVKLCNTRESGDLDLRLPSVVGTSPTVGTYAFL